MAINNEDLKTDKGFGNAPKPDQKSQQKKTVAELAKMHNPNSPMT
jgi:hypothetical protein